MDTSIDLRLQDLEKFIFVLSRYFVIHEYGVSTKYEWTLTVQNPLDNSIIICIDITPFDLGNKVDLEYTIHSIATAMKSSVDSNRQRQGVIDI